MRLETSARIPAALGLPLLLQVVGLPNANAYQTLQECRRDRDRVFAEWQRESREHDSLAAQCARLNGQAHTSCMKSNNIDARTREVADLRSQYSSIDKECNVLYENSLPRDHGYVAPSRPQPSYVPPSSRSTVPAPASSYPSQTPSSGSQRSEPSGYPNDIVPERLPDVGAPRRPPASSVGGEDWARQQARQRADQQQRQEQAREAQLKAEADAKRRQLEAKQKDDAYRASLQNPWAPDTAKTKTKNPFE